MMSPKPFSVAMCVYIKDNPRWFDEALMSVFNQSYCPSEVVLVTDGPVTTDIDAVISKYIELGKPLKVIRLKENVGFGNACQACVENATYELIARMDSDDVCLTDRFEKQIKEFVEDPELDIVGGSIGYFTETTDNIFSYWHPPLSYDEILRTIKKQSPFNHVTVMFKKDAVRKAGGYIEWYCEEDYYLWARMLNNGSKAKNLQDVLVYVRTSPEQMARRGGWKYYKSEFKMHTYLLKSGRINIIQYILNICVRFGVEIICTPRMRLWLRKKFIWRNKK